MPDGVIRYPRYRFPPAIISHAVWLYYRFTLSFRDVEDLLALRGITVSYKTVRRWCQTFGLAYARRLRRHRSPRQLLGRTSQRHAVRRARHHTLRQQPSRSLAPAHAATRGSDAALQVRGPGTAIPLRPRCDSQPVHRRPAFTSRRPPAAPAHEGARHLEHFLSSASDAVHRLDTATNCVVELVNLTEPSCHHLYISRANPVCAV